MSSRKKKPDRWSFTAGERPNQVTVEERRAGGPLYGRVWNPSTGNWARKSLKHSDKVRAKAWALDQAAKLTRGEEAMRTGKATLEQVFAAYVKHRTPRKKEGEQKQDGRRVQLWKAVLGSGIDPHNVRLADWERFIDLRSSGAIDPRCRVTVDAPWGHERSRPTAIGCVGYSTGPRSGVRPQVIT